MKERPILFSAPMVKAILDGGKTQTRRVIRPQPIESQDGKWDWWPRGRWDGAIDPRTGQHSLGVGPHGAPGDRLWVRETHKYCRPRWGGNGHLTRIGYRADDSERTIDLPESRLGTADPRGDWSRWRPSIHMPRWASRILLEVTDVRVERVQDISTDDVRAEGIPGGTEVTAPMVRGEFASLWDEINARRGYPWASNCWVWVVSFRRIEP